MKWKLAIGIAFSALFLWLAFREARLGEIWRALASARYWYMLPGLGLTLIAFALRAWRWRFLLAPVQDIPFPPLFSSTMIGFMGNNVLPARLGELLRAHSLGRSTGASRSAVLASIVVERIFDIFVMLFLFGAILVLRGLPSDIRSWGLVLLIAITPVWILLLAFRAYSGFFLRMTERILPPAWRSRAREMGLNFRRGLDVFGRGRTIVAALICSLLMWLSLVGVVELCFRALGLKLPVDAGVVVLVVMAIGTMIPAAPGYIGTMQYAGTLALLQYAVPRSVALSFTLLYHAGQWIPVTAIGLIYFLRENLSVKQLPALQDSGRGSAGPIDFGGARSALPGEIEGKES
jgi:glycosyltransferase 2 family protein